MMISASTLLLATAIGTQAWTQSTADRDGTERRGHKAATIFVDSQASSDGDGSASAPYQTITQAVERARDIRGERRTKIIVHVAPGEYVENFPIYLNVSNVELRGGTRLVEDEDGLPQNCGTDLMPFPCIEAGSETVLAPAHPLTSGQVLLFIAPTRDSWADRLRDVTVRGFVFDGRSATVATSGVAAFVDRVENFSMQENVSRQVQIGIFTRMASGNIDRHFAYNSNDGFAISGGSRIYPARVAVRASRLMNNLTQGAVALGTAAVKAQQSDPYIKELQTIFDPAGHPEEVPDRLNITVIGNDISHNPSFGFRFENYINGDAFYDTTDNQPMTSHITTTIRANSYNNNGEYGVTVEGAFATRTNPCTFTGEFTGSFENNDLTENGRAGVFIGFMLNGVVTRNPGLINVDKYLQDSRFSVDADEETGSFDVDFDNPVLDRFDKTTPLNNVLTINSATITGTHVTCPPGFTCVQ